MQLAMTMMIRDAADVIEANLRYHHAQGVDLFVVADNGSTDGTLAILERYQEAGLAKIERMPGPPGVMWKEARTKIARRACELGADWVILNDDDEFWWPLTGDLKETLAAIPERFGMVVGPRTEFVARPGESFFADRLTIREARFLRPPKAAHRPHPRIVVRSAHPTPIWLENAPAGAFAGRPGLRGSGADHAAKANLELLFAPTYPIRILHFPIRSFAQYRRRVEIANAAQLLEDEDREKVRTAFETGRLDEVYDALTLSDEEVAKGIAEGWLVQDTDFRDYLAVCPDPLTGGEAPAGSRAWPLERRELELAELELDAMYALTRYVRGDRTGDRGGRHQVHTGTEGRLRRRLQRRDRRIERLERRLGDAERRLRDIRGSRWWRLRPRLPGRVRRQSVRNS